MPNDLSTLLCLFHHRDNAHAALQDILKAGVPEANVTLIGDTGSTIETSTGTLNELNVPERDHQHLLAGLGAGGAILSVSAISDHAEKVEAIFKAHSAEKIDEDDVDDDMGAGSATPLLANELDRGSLDGDDLDEEAEADLTPNPIRVYRVLPVSPLSSEVDDLDEDPRELGLDARMNPISRQ